MNPSPQLWASQARAYEMLREIGELFYFSDWGSLPVKPRLNPLCIGASGVGKTFLVKSVAESLEVAYLRATGSSWLVIGSARENTPTLLRIKQFVADNDRGLIHLDEIDKISGGLSGNSGSSDSWSRYLVGEVFDLLDRAPAPVKGHEWTPELIDKLQHDFWIVATGTWQQIWRDVAKAKVGFGNPEDSTSIVAEVRRLVATTEVIPQELLRRLNSNLVVIGQATADEYLMASESFGLSKLARALNIELDFNAAVQSGLGSRWLEETCAQLLLQARRENRTDLLGLRPFTPENAPEPEEKHEFGLDDHVL